MNQAPRAANNANPFLAVISLCFGLGGLFAFLPMVLLLPCAVLPIGFGIAAVVVGMLAISRIRRDANQVSGRGVAIAGVIAGALAIVGPVIWVVLALVIYFYLGSGQLSRPFM